MHYNRSVKEPVMTTSEAQRQRVYELCDLAKKIVAGPGDAIELRAYEPQEIADALRKLISDEIAVEREACARLAANIRTSPRMLTVPMEIIRSLSSASISGATATIALVPQMAVPAPISSPVRGKRPNHRASHTVAASATTMHSTVMASDREPTDATRTRFNPAPVSTMVTGITRRANPLAPSMVAAGSGSRLRTTTPATIAIIAALTG